MNKNGSLYKVKRYCWILFSSKETAINAATTWTNAYAPTATYAASVARGAAAAAAYWSKQLNCNVLYVYPDDILVFLEKDGKFYKFLSTNGEMGWTWFGEDNIDCFEEANQ